MGASRDCTGVYSEVGSEGVSAAISVLCVFVWRRYGADPAGDGKALAARGWRCNAGFSVIMPNNYVLFPGFDVDSKELEKKKLTEAVPALEKVSRLITGRETVFACKEGSLPFIRRGSSIRYLFVIRCLPNLSMQRVSASGASAVKKVVR